MSVVRIWEQVDGYGAFQGKGPFWDFETEDWDWAIKHVAVLIWGGWKRLYKVYIDVSEEDYVVHWKPELRFWI